MLKEVERQAWMRYTARKIEDFEEPGSSRDVSALVARRVGPDWSWGSRTSPMAWLIIHLRPRFVVAAPKRKTSSVFDKMPSCYTINVGEKASYLMAAMVRVDVLLPDTSREGLQH